MSTTAIIVVTVGATIAAIVWACCWAAVRIAQHSNPNKGAK
jgi:hypothetical protein